MNKTVRITVSEKPHAPWRKVRMANRRNVVMSFYKDNGEVDAVELYDDVPEGRAWVAVHAIKEALEAMGHTVILGEKP